MSDDLDAWIAQEALRDRLEVLGPLFEALAVIAAEARHAEHALAPLTWSVKRSSSLLEMCDQLWPLAYDFHAAAAEALDAQAEERGDPPPLLPDPFTWFRP